MSPQPSCEEFAALVAGRARVIDELRATIARQSEQIAEQATLIK